MSTYGGPNECTWTCPHLWTGAETRRLVSSLPTQHRIQQQSLPPSPNPSWAQFSPWATFPPLSFAPSALSRTLKTHNSAQWRLHCCQRLTIILQALKLGTNWQYAGTTTVKVPYGTFMISGASDRAFRCGLLALNPVFLLSVHGPDHGCNMDSTSRCMLIQKSQFS